MSNDRQPPCTPNVSPLPFDEWFSALEYSAAWTVREVCEVAWRAAINWKESAPVSETGTPMLAELCTALGWQGGTIHQVVERVALLRAALQEITRGAGPFNSDPLKHADNCIESMKSIATGALEGTWSPE